GCLGFACLLHRSLSSATAAAQQWQRSKWCARAQPWSPSSETRFVLSGGGGSRWGVRCRACAGSAHHACGLICLKGAFTRSPSGHGDGVHAVGRRQRRLEATEELFGGRCECVALSTSFDASFRLLILI